MGDEGGGKVSARKTVPVRQAPVQSAPQRIAREILAAPGRALPAPVRGDMESRFGRPLDRIRYHDDTNAERWTRAGNATALTVGPHIAFGAGTFSPGTVAGRALIAHELAHAVQQGGIPNAGDWRWGASQSAAEHEADAAAASVMSGHQLARPVATSSGEIQRRPAPQPCSSQLSASTTTQASQPDPTPEEKVADEAEAIGKNTTLESSRENAHVKSSTGAHSQGDLGTTAEIAPPKSGINKTGFIDNSDGANIRTGPREAGGKALRDEPLPPATRVFVSGTHPHASEWWYVTAYFDGMMVRGYVQSGRVNVDLPEPTAQLYEVVSGDTAECLARLKFSTAVRDGHDLRYYENVLLYVNRQQHRDGVTGSYQDPGIIHHSGNSVQLVAGRRIWLVSPAYAKAVESVVPDGSLTGGGIAKVRRFVRHLEDIIHSVTEAPDHFGDVAGEYAQAIRDHRAEVIGIVAAFLMAEAASLFLAAAPTGVSQIAAAVIQLGLAAFGAAGMVQAGIEAVKHAGEWLTIAWTADGDPKKIAAASVEFVKMLVSIAMAALAYLGVKGNYGNALRIASEMPTSGLPALALVGDGRMGVGAGTGVLINPSAATPAAVGNAMMQGDDKSSGGKGDEPTPTDQDPADELKKIEEDLKKPEDLSGGQKRRLRARRKVLREQLGQTADNTPVPADDVPSPTEFKQRAPGLTGKEASTDVPSWIESWPDARPGVDESGTMFATRMMNKRYGVEKWTRTGRQGAEFSELKNLATEPSSNIDVIRDLLAPRRDQPRREQLEARALRRDA